jgi:hypothetical protein
VHIYEATEYDGWNKLLEGRTTLRYDATTQLKLVVRQDPVKTLPRRLRVRRGLGVLRTTWCWIAWRPTGQPRDQATWFSGSWSQRIKGGATELPLSQWPNSTVHWIILLQPGLIPSRTALFWLRAFRNYLQENSTLNLLRCSWSKQHLKSSFITSKKTTRLHY